MKLVPIRDFEWTDDFSFHRDMTCINHPTARYSTKNPYVRSIFCHKLPEGDDFERSETGECLCPKSDLAVIVEEEEEVWIDPECGCKRSPDVSKDTPCPEHN